MSETDDDKLIADATSGREEALVSLLKRYGPQVRRRLGGKIGQQWLASMDEDDVLQVTYMEAFQRIDRFTPRGPGSFLAWLSHIAENNLRDAIKALERLKRPQPGKRVQEPGSEILAALLEVVGTTSSTPSRHAAFREAKDILESAIKRLPADYGRVVRMLDIEGKTPAQTAAEMKRSEGAIHMLRAGAHDRLREALGSESRYFSKVGPPRAS